MTSKRTLVLVVLILLVYSLSCGFAFAAGEEKGKTIHLRFLAWYQDEGRKNVMANYLKKYKDKFPNYEIEFEVSSEQVDLWNKIKTYAASGELPDVLYAWVPGITPLVKAKLLANLMPYVTKDGFYKRYFDTACVKPFKDGGLYAINGGIDFYFAPVMFYHKDLLAKYNLQVPRTFGDWLEVCKTLRTNGITPIALSGKDGLGTSYWFIQLFYMAEDPQAVKDLVDKKTDWTNPAFARAVDKIRQMVQAGCFAPDVATTEYGSAMTDFVEKRAAFWFNGAWELPTVAKDPDVDLMNLPVMNPAVPDTGVAVEFWGARQGGYSVSAKSKNVDAAVKMAEYSANSDALYYGNATKMPLLFDTGIKVELPPLALKQKQRVDRASFKLPNIVEWIMSPKTTTEYLIQCSSLMTGASSGAAFTKAMQDTWKDNWADVIE